MVNPPYHTRRTAQPAAECEKDAVYNTVHPGTDAIEIRRVQDCFLVTQPIPSLPGNGEEELSAVEFVNIRVTHSLLFPLCLDDSTCSANLFHGYIVDDLSAPVLAISPSNASSIRISVASVFNCLSSGGRATYDSFAVPTLLRHAAFAFLEGHALSRVKDCATVILHEPDQFPGAVFRYKAAQLGLKCIVTTSSQSSEGDKSRSEVPVHPHAPKRLERYVKNVIPRDAKLLVDLSGSVSDEHHLPWRAYLPVECKL